MFNRLTQAFQEPTIYRLKIEGVDGSLFCRLILPLSAALCPDLMSAWLFGRPLLC